MTQHVQAPVADSTVDPESALSQNDAVIKAIRGHHAQLAEQLNGYTLDVLTAASDGGGLPERDVLHRWYRNELLPHAAAEERALYEPGLELEATRLLVQGMIGEHRHLEKLVAQLTRAEQPVALASVAAAAHAVFTVHLGKENDLLLPALDQAGVVLSTVLEGMHEILGHGEAAPEPSDSACGCGGCGCGQNESADVSVSSSGQNEIDVRALPHGQRHEIIFARLDGLELDEALVICNDHDPKPLRYQTQALWPDRFVWSYLQAGPQEWRVAITRVG